jgi:hypothetical protein
MLYKPKLSRKSAVRRDVDKNGRSIEGWSEVQIFQFFENHSQRVGGDADQGEIAIASQNNSGPQYLSGLDILKPVRGKNKRNRRIFYTPDPVPDIFPTYQKYENINRPDQWASHIVIWL